MRDETNSSCEICADRPRRPAPFAPRYRTVPNWQNANVSRPVSAMSSRSLSILSFLHADTDWFQQPIKVRRIQHNFAPKERFHTGRRPLFQFRSSTTRVPPPFGCGLIFLSALSAARSKSSIQAPECRAPKETTTAAANAMISSTERTPGWTVWRNRLSRQTFRSAGETHPTSGTPIRSPT
jgi:hypothetical protein